MDQEITNLIMKPSYYYKYNFVSPEPLYAEVKEELKSYFQTGVVDDLLFSRYTEDCLSRLGRSSYKIVENVFRLEDFSFNTPEGFEAVRELWLVAPHERSYQMPSATYEQSTIRITPIRDRCDGCDVLAPRELHITYKTTGKILQKFNTMHLLKPGNVHAKSNCSLDSLNFQADPGTLETFDIRDNKIVTNFPEGFIYMVYYVKEYDSNEYQLIPDNIRIKDYIKSYLKYKCFETVFNNVSDETFNQLQNKLQYYERKADEAKVIAETEIKKQTFEQSIRAVKTARRRFNKYRIS